MTLVNMYPEIESTSYYFGIELHFFRLHPLLFHNTHQYASTLRGYTEVAATACYEDSCDVNTQVEFYDYHYLTM